jgi:hypothetical protein
LPAKANTTYDIHIKAALGTSTKANTAVIDHTDSFKIYALSYGQFTTSTTNIILDDLTAHSKWNSNRKFYYNNVVINGSDTPAHPAGSFAILDTILDAQRQTDELSSVALESTTSFPSMQVTWAATKGLSTEITSYYHHGRLHILGQQNEDTDEFDEHVVAHEWGHYLVHAFSRDDTLSGDHKSRDFLDPTVAFSEGFANAFYAISTGIEIYKDTNGADQRGRLVYNDLEKGDLGAADGVALTNALDLSYEGLYSEDSVAEIVVDILDAYNPNDLPVDTLQIPFSQILTLLKTEIKTTPPMTSIVEFLFLLKNNTQNINDTAAKALIPQLADNENIGDIQEFENSGHSFSEASLGANDKYEFYTTITANDVSVFKDSIGQDLFIGHNDYGTLYHPSTGRLNNKLLYRRFFVTSPTTAGCYELSAKSVNGDPIGIETPIYFVKAIKQSETLNLNIAANKSIGFAVFANSQLNFSVKVHYIADRCD